MVTLKAARVNKGYTQADAARLLGISVDTLGNYERGKSYPDVPIIAKIETLYGVQYKDIFFKASYCLTVEDEVAQQNPA